MMAANKHWTSHTIAGHTCNVYQPASVSEHNNSVIYLHDVDLESLHGKKRFLKLFEKFGLTVFAPQCGPTWWSDRVNAAFDPRLSPEEYLLEHIMPFVHEFNGAKPKQVALLGVCMGGQGALRFAYKFPDIFPVVAALSPAIDYHLRIDEGDEILMEMYGDRESARQESALLHIHPLNWPRHQFFCCDPKDPRWFDSVDRLRMKLWSLGVMHTCDLETSSGRHGFKYYNRMAEKAVTFLHHGLEQERLRIV